MMLVSLISDDDGDENEDRDVDRRVSSVLKQTITTQRQLISLNQRSSSIGENGERLNASSPKLAGVVSRAMDADEGLCRIG